VPSGAQYEVLVLPVDKPEIPRLLKGLRILHGDIPLDRAATRWRFGDAEFRFYFNDTDFAKDYAVGSGSFELWDARTGQVTPYTQARLQLDPGKAALLLRK